MENKGNSIIRKKAMDFSVRMFHLNEYLVKQKKYSIADKCSGLARLLVLMCQRR